MQLDSIALIVVAEVVAVLLIFCVILLVQNRSLRGLVKKLQNRMTQLVEELKLSKSSPAPIANAEQEEVKAVCQTYVDMIDIQLEETKNQHASLDPDRDIVLDLAPDTELPRRAAALRYALLLAEKEAHLSVLESEEPVDWSILRAKYHQNLDFYEDYMPEPEQVANHDELDALNQELTNAKKRINNLEKFKALYFDLEEKWEDSKKEADHHYRDLSEMASEVSDSAKFESALESYHSAYNSVDKMIQVGIGDPETILETVKITDEATSGELRHLRMVAADQHKIITDLESKLKNASTNEERNQIVDGLKGQLDQQKRFMQESETCIQLMEEELQNAHRELDQLKGRLKALPSIKTQLQEIRKSRDEYELKVYALTSENRKLTKKLKEDQGSSMAETGESTKLKKELNDLETRYANLEEKYLDLKLKQ